MGYLIVFLGAGVGGALRHGVNQASVLGWAAFPIGTLAVNVIGSFLIGVVAGYFAERTHLPPHWHLFLTTGILGGFTTFSAFSLDAVHLYERGRPVLAAADVMASVILSVAALFAGLAILRSLMKA